MIYYTLEVIKCERGKGKFATTETTVLFIDPTTFEWDDPAKVQRLIEAIKKEVQK